VTTSSSSRSDTDSASVIALSPHGRARVHERGASAVFGHARLFLGVPHALKPLESPQSCSETGERGESAASSATSIVEGAGRGEGDLQGMTSLELSRT